MEQLGALVEGKYEVVAKLREGGMGAIYKVRHRLLDEIRIIKVMRQGVEGDTELRRRFLEEAKTATRLKHPNICTIYDFAMDQDGTAYLVMEFIDGVTLAELLRAQGSPGLGLSLEIAHQTLQALAYLHRKSVVHRDIAPDNIMLTSDEDENSLIKLIDLGIAKVLNRQSEMTSTGVFLGKVRYASPEQFGALAPGEVIDGRGDLYSLGLVLYELLTGKKAFLGDTPVELMRAHVFQPPVPFERSDPEGRVPPDLRVAVLKALEKRREDRFHSAGEFDRRIMDISKSLDRTEVLDVTQAITRVRRTSKSPQGSVSPSAEERLNERFVAKTTPLPSPMPQVPDTLIQPEVRHEEILEQIARDEDAGNQASLEALRPQWPADGTLGRAVRAALDRVRERERERQRLEMEELRRRQQEEELRQREEADWALSEGEASVEGWERYLERYPLSSRREEANRRLAELNDYREAAQEDSLGAWQRLADRWPEGKFRAEAESRIAQHREQAFYKKLLETETPPLCREFLKLFPNSTRAKEVRGLLEERIQFEAAAETDTDQAWADFLARFPGSSLTSRARQRFEQTRRRAQEAEQREDAAFTMALEKKTPEAFRAFLAAHPKGRNRDYAQALLAETLSFEAARGAGSKALEEFLRASPKSIHAGAARLALEQLRQEALLKRIAEAEARQDIAELKRLADQLPPAGLPGQAARRAFEKLHEEALLKRIADAEKAAEIGPLNRLLKELPAEGRPAEAARRALERVQEALLLKLISDAEKAEDLDALRSFAAQLPPESRGRETAREALARLEEARRKAQEEADWSAAEQADTSEGWQGFLSSYPKSARLPDARRRLSAAQKREAARKQQEREEEKAWQRAQKANTEKAWERFLLSHPSSAKANQARQALLQLRAAAVAAADEERRRADAKAAASALAMAPHALEEREAEAPPPVAKRPIGLRLGVPLIVVVLAVAGALYLKNASKRSSPVALGSLGVDAIPWARIAAVEDASGKNVLGGREEYTPASFSLPAGRYTVRLKSSGSRDKEITLSVEVSRGQRTVSTGRFEAIDAASYFADDGWVK